MAFLERKDRIDHLRQNLEPAYARGDAESHRRAAYKRQARVLDEHSQAQLEIHRQALEPGPDPNVSGQLTRQRKAAHRSLGGGVGFVAVKAGRLQLPPLHFEMKLHLVVQVSAEAAGQKGVPKPPQELLHEIRQASRTR
jgi:hypothetical protein